MHLSKLICYCQAKRFNEQSTSSSSSLLFSSFFSTRKCIVFLLAYQNNHYYEICSFSDGKKYFGNNWPQKLNTYHNRVLSRVYPAFHRYDSLNYDPSPYWDLGFQLVAINYQTPDKSMQLNQAKFEDNGRYISQLKWDYFFKYKL